MPQELAYCPHDRQRPIRFYCPVTLGAHMRKLALAAAALAFTSSAYTGSAYAADVPLKAPPPMAAPAVPFNWGGWYIGLNAGAGWTREFLAAAGETGGRGPIPVLSIPPRNGERH